MGLQRGDAAPTERGESPYLMIIMTSDIWQAAGRTRGSVSTQSVALARHRTESASVVNRVRSESNRTQSVHQPELDADAEFINHAVEPRARTAQLPPILSKKVDEHSLSGLAFEQDCIITSCQEGRGVCILGRSQC